MRTIEIRINSMIDRISFRKEGISPVPNRRESKRLRFQKSSHHVSCALADGQMFFFGDYFRFESDVTRVRGQEKSKKAGAKDTGQKVKGKLKQKMWKCSNLIAGNRIRCFVRRLLHKMQSFATPHHLHSTHSPHIRSHALLMRKQLQSFVASA